MSATSKPATVLSGAKLGRASWGTPIWMTVWLIVLAYIIAWIVAGYMGQPADWCRRCAPTPAWAVLKSRIGILTPLWWGLGVSAVGLLVGTIAMMAAEERTQKALNFKFLEADHWLTKRVHHLAAQLDLPPPRVALMNANNAFAVGTDKSTAAVVLGVPLVKSLQSDELNAVIGHELGHIASGDMRGMVFAEGYQSLFGGAFAVFAFLLQTLIMVATKQGFGDRGSALLVNGFSIVGRYLFAFVGEVLTKGLSRKREFYADAVGAALASPDAMARALQRIAGQPVKATPAEDKYAYLMFRGSGGDLFSTHPTTADRVAALTSGAYLERMRTSHASAKQRKALAQAGAQQAMTLGTEGVQAAGRSALGAARGLVSALSVPKTETTPAASPSPPLPRAKGPRQRIEPTF